MRQTTIAHEDKGGGSDLMVRTTLYLPRWVRDKARASGMNLSRMATAALKEKLSTDKRADELTERIKVLEVELAALRIEASSRTTAGWELERIRAAAAWRFVKGVERPGASFTGWWNSETVRMDFPQHFDLDAETVWTELRGGKSE